MFDAKQYATDYYEKNRESILQKHKARYAAGDKAKHNARVKAWQKANPKAVLRAARRTRGLPDPTRPEPAQCECCGKPQAGRAMSLDHCHETGEFRGWLCHKCNSGIGALGDDIDGVSLALKYLHRHHFEIKE